jgi:predicted enzyme related to lactoylglutathione lyase
MLSDSPMYSYVPVKDLARARAFYEEKLGFTPDREMAGGISYKAGNGTAFFMYPSAGAGTSRASQAFWQVPDVRAEVAELKRRGVVFEEYDNPGYSTVDGIATGGGAMSAWFKDTEGNILAISQSI